MGQTAVGILKVQGRKVAEMTTVSFDLKSNGALIVTADDVVKSRGKATCEASYETIRAVGGSRFDVESAVINQTVLALTLQVDGGMFEVTGTFDSTTVKGDVAKGQTDGSHKFSGAVRWIPG
jgi:hypothetical protein